MKKVFLFVIVLFVFAIAACNFMGNKENVQTDSTKISIDSVSVDSVLVK